MKAQRLHYWHARFDYPVPRRDEGSGDVVVEHRRVRQLKNGGRTKRFVVRARAHGVRCIACDQARRWRGPALARERMTGAPSGPSLSPPRLIVCPCAKIFLKLSSRRLRWVCLHGAVCRHRPYSYPIILHLHCPLPRHTSCTPLFSVTSRAETRQRGSSPSLTPISTVGSSRWVLHSDEMHSVL